MIQAQAVLKAIEVFLVVRIARFNKGAFMEPSTRQLKQAPRLRLHFNVHQPIELLEMTFAFQGLGSEYHRYLKESNTDDAAPKNASDVKLYITKIESNCILAEIAPALPLLGQITPIFANANTVSDFIVNTKKSISWLKRVAKKKSIAPDEVIHSKQTLQSLRSIVGLVGKNKNGELKMAAVKYKEVAGDSVSLEVTFSSDECQQASIGASVAIAALEQRERADKEGVLMYLYQANKDDPKKSGQTGNKALIASIHSRPLKVYIITETDRQKIRHVLDDKAHNPLHTGFLVDVNVERDPVGKPKLYRVLRVHDVIYDDE